MDAETIPVKTADLDPIFEMVDESPVEPVAMETPAVPAAAPTPAVPVPAKPIEQPAHAKETLAYAEHLGISAADIEAMTPRQLELTVSHIARAMLSAQPKEPVQEAPAAVDPLDAILADLADEKKWDADHAKPIMELVKQNKQLMGVVARLQQGQADIQGNEIRRRIEPMLSDLDPSLVSEYKSPKAWSELMGAMSAVLSFEKQAGKYLAEPERLQRAIAMLGKTAVRKDPEAEAKAAAFEKAKAEQDAAALGVPQNRKKSANLIDLVNQKIKKRKPASAEKTNEVVENIFEPLPG